jgi:hypothetical protein
MKNCLGAIMDGLLLPKEHGRVGFFRIGGFIVTVQCYCLIIGLASESWQDRDLRKYSVSISDNPLRHPALEAARDDSRIFAGLLSKTLNSHIL